LSRVQYYCAASLDGYIAGPGDELDWLLGYEPAERDEGAAADPMAEGGSYERFYDGVGALVSGSVTYEWILEHLDEWPYAGKPYWVLSSRDLARPPGAEAEVRVVEAAVAEIHDELAAAAGERNLWIVGGGPVASQYAEAGLLDEVLLTVVPVMLGEGKPLFERPPPGGPLRLTGTTALASGMVELRYELGDGRAAGGG